MKLTHDYRKYNVRLASADWPRAIARVTKYYWPRKHDSIMIVIYIYATVSWKTNHIIDINTLFIYIDAIMQSFFDNLTYLRNVISVTFRIKTHSCFALML